jgi:hypothetical protein
MTNFIFPYEDHISTGIVFKGVSEIDAIRSSVPSGVPIFIFSDENHMVLPDNYDDLFFEALISDFTDPDAYGAGMSYQELVQYNSNNNIDNTETINEINKVKNRTISINMNKARNIWKDKLRADRKPLLETLDVQYIRALERGQTETIQKIVKKKEFLRDITEDPRIENAENTDDLKEVTIPHNFIEE